MARITVSHEEGVMTATMSNPDRKNALDRDATEAMAEHLREAAHDTSVRCVVVTVEGDAFCSGIDLASDLGGGRTLSTMVGSRPMTATPGRSPRNKESQ
jgi:2-(1,2-epoxy-1,2-dihydrophenyl)acetyl-CoA isomerase